MQAFPHHYSVVVNAQPEGDVTTTGANIPSLQAGPPPQFGGEGGLWSPEDLLMAAVANCFTLAFKAIAAASRLEWVSLECHSEGELNKVERQIKFTSITTTAKLVIPAGGNVEKAEKMLQKAETACLVSNSLNCDIHLEVDVQLQQ